MGISQKDESRVPVSPSHLNLRLYPYHPQFGNYLVFTWVPKKTDIAEFFKWGLGDDNPLTLGMILPYNIPSFMMVGAREFLPSFFQRSHPRGAHPSAQWDPHNPVILNGCLGRLGRRNIHHCPMCW